MRWKTFTRFCSKFIQKTVYQISSESPEFYGIYYRKHVGLFFFLNTLYIILWFIVLWIQCAEAIQRKTMRDEVGRIHAFVTVVWLTTEEPTTIPIRSTVQRVLKYTVYKRAILLWRWFCYILIDFQDYLTAGKSVKFLTEQYIILFTTPKTCCRTTSRNSNVQICCIFCTFCVSLKGSYQTHGGNFITS